MPPNRDPLVVGGIVGDVVDPFKPTVTLQIRYNNTSVVNAREFMAPMVAGRPRVLIGGDDFRNSYTLVMVDPDAPNPSDPSLREYLHWLVTDIPGSTGTNFGNEVICYESPRPAMGIHRFVFVLFQQLGRHTVFAPVLRHNFSTRDFAEIYNLGSPVAALYFNCHREGSRRSSAVNISE